MIPNLTITQLRDLLQTVFHLTPAETGLSMLVDLPNHSNPDNPAWIDRRDIALEWFKSIQQSITLTPFQSVNFISYENIGSNNSDLPDVVTMCPPDVESVTMNEGESVKLEQILKSSSVLLAMTQLSATAPLKILARQYGFRGATLPGFSRSMIPTLALDYEKVHDRVMVFKKRMDDALGIKLRLSVNGTVFESFFDLRFRLGHASGGLMREPGMVANLPSGEAYIVPYEGEKQNEPSRTSGALPVQFDQEIVVYVIEANRARRVLSTGKFSQEEARKLEEEPAYGNIAEVGIGVLGEWGVTAVGSTLLDEKLGLHIAFGRSEHFGGITGPSAFNNPKNVIHIDRVYVPSVQPMITVDEVTFLFENGRSETIMRSGKFIV